MTGSHSIDYETLQSEAMRGVVRAVLARTAKSGLPGDHHFYISFDTGSPGVSLSKRLKEKYPSEMTVVLQHRFWDLIVSEDRFEVKLTFDGIPERLVVPFTALKVFFDPSVRYGLQFEDSELSMRAQSMASNGLDDEAGVPGASRAPARKPRTPRKPKAERDAATANTRGNTQADDAATPGKISRVTPMTAKSDGSATDAANAPVDEPADDTAGEFAGENVKPESPAGAQILSLDKFRKK